MSQLSQQRLLFLTHVGDPGGAEYKMLTLCEGFPQVEVITFAHGSLQALLNDAGIAASVIEAPAALQQFRREDGLLAALKTLPALTVTLHRLARALTGADVLIPMSQKAFVLTALLKPFVRKPIVWYMNDLVSKAHFNPRTIALLTRLARYSANYVIVNSESSKHQWLCGGGDAQRTRISYSGIDIGGFDSAKGSVTDIQCVRREFAADHTPLVAIVGRVSSWKGQDVFLDALSQVPEVAGVIIGEALFGERSFETSIKERILNTELNTRVTMAGHRNDIPNLLAAADIVVHCSTAPEPFGRVIVEAMLAGTPVIAADSGGPTEIITHGRTGYLTPPGDAQALAVMIKYVLAHPDERRQIATRAQQESRQRFSGKAMIRDLQQLLDAS